MDFQKEIEKINISNVLRTKPASSLTEILNRLEREELLLIAKERGMTFRFRTKKEAVIPRLLKYTLSSKRIENVLTIAEHNEYDLFLELFESDKLDYVN